MVDIEIETVDKIQSGTELNSFLVLLLLFNHKIILTQVEQITHSIPGLDFFTFIGSLQNNVHP